MHHNKIFLTFMSSVLVGLIAIGISLFFMREQMVPQEMGHELIIRPPQSTENISTTQFLILVDETHISKMHQILEPLALEVKMPILNWILVERRGAARKIAEIGSDEAAEARLTLNSLIQNPLVLDAQHNYIMDNTALKDEWISHEQWHLQNASKETPAALDLPRAWEITRGSADVSIAVVDQFSSHDRFTFLDNFSSCKNRVTLYQPFPHLKGDRNSPLIPHGELMLLALGACNNVETYRFGIDFNAKILAFDRPFLGHAETFLTALTASNIDVCKGSIIGCPKGVQFELPQKTPDILLLPLGNDAPDLLQFSADMISAINNKGVIVVTGAGNERINADSFFPAGSPSVINVGAINKKGERAKFSNWGASLDLLAPGAFIKMVYPNGPKNVAGTSMAAAFTAGTIALMKAVNPNITFRSAEQILSTSGHPLTCEQYCREDNPISPCTQLCCHHQDSCGKIALNTHQAVRNAAANKPLPPLLRLEKTYLLYLRDELAPQEITVSNVGDADARVITTIFDDNIEITPHAFFLAKRGSLLSSAVVKISLRREPFKRQTSKIEFSATADNKTVDRVEFYLEYIPKK